MRRPAVVLEDLRLLPGRAGLGAAVLCLYLLALAITPYGAGAAQGVLALGIGAHLGLTAALLYTFATGPAEQRRVNPTWHLVFSGWVVAALAALAQGLTLVAVGLFWTALVAAVLIWTASLQQLTRQSIPAPLRPLLAIHLAPAALLGLVAAGLGGAAISYVFAMLCALGLLFCLVRLRWLLAAGFSPLWGAFTFPLAAIANLWLTLGDIWLWPGAVALVVASLAVPAIALRLFRMWAKGELAPKTGAVLA